MSFGERIFLMRYISEERRRIAAARMHYLSEALWCIALVLLGAGTRP